MIKKKKNIKGYIPVAVNGKDICTCGHKRHDHQLKKGMCYVHHKYCGSNFRCVCDKFKLAKAYINDNLKGGQF